MIMRRYVGAVFVSIESDRFEMGILCVAIGGAVAVTTAVLALIVTVEFINSVAIGDAVLADVVLMSPCSSKQMSLNAFTALFASASLPQVCSAHADMLVKPATKLVPRESPVHTQPYEIQLVTNWTFRRQVWVQFGCEA